MKRSIIPFITCWLLAAPLWGGTIYVPLVIELELGGHLFTTQVRVTNNSDEVRELHYLYLENRSDGTVPVRADHSQRMGLSPRETELLTDFAGSGARRGILEIVADMEVSISSRLVRVVSGQPTGSGTEVPVLTSENLQPAATSAALQGWRRDGQYATDFYVLNLDHSAASCQITVYQRSGVQITTQTLPVKPLSLQYFDDVLNLLGENNRDDVSAMVSCNRSFHAFAMTVDKASGDLAYIPPSGTGASLLTPPNGIDPPPAFNCPSGAIFRKDSAFHRPTPGKEARRFEIPTPTGQVYTRIEVDVDFTPDDWANPADGNHAVFWLNRTERWASNVFGYVNVFGPNKNFGKISTNAGFAPGAQLRAHKTKEVVFEKGVTYHVNYVFDTNLRLMEAIFTTGTGTADEQEVGRATGSTTVNQIRTQEPGFFIYFGHPTGTAGPEVRTYNWLYSNLCVQMR